MPATNCVVYIFIKQITTDACFVHKKIVVYRLQSFAVSLNSVEWLYLKRETNNNNNNGET